MEKTYNAEKPYAVKLHKGELTGMSSSYCMKKGGK